MSGKQPVEVLLRPAVELYTVAACAGAAFLCLVAPWSLALSPRWASAARLAFGAYGAIRYRDARVILRYRRNIRRLPRYVMTSKDVPVSQQRLFVGRGFLWEQKHTHRLMQTYRPEFRRYVEPTPAYRLAQAPGGTAGVRAVPAVRGCPRSRAGTCPSTRCARCRLSAACRGCTASNPTRWTSACRWASASGTRWCWAPRGWARRAWPSCSSPRTSGVRTPRASTRS